MADCLENRLLALLPEEERQNLLRTSVVVSLPRTKELYCKGQAIDAVYFPFDCMISVIVDAGDGTPVEMATIGNEGSVGVELVLATDNAIATTVVQVAGDALRIDVERFKQYMQTNHGFAKLIYRYLYALMHQIMQVGACNRLHAIEKRCARWLLMTHDRKRSDRFLLTQEYLSEMLGVRRATVNVAVGLIKARGYIKYVRGQITILDRAGLESLSCSCYALIRQEYEALSLQ